MSRNSPRSIRVMLASTLELVPHHRLNTTAIDLPLSRSRNSISNVRRRYCLGRLFDLKGVDQDLGGRSGRGRVLAGDQQSVGDDVDIPVFDLGESGTEAEQLVLNE